VAALPRGFPQRTTAAQVCLAGPDAARRAAGPARSHRATALSVSQLDRGVSCPHHCDFCYKDAFYRGGKSFYTQEVDAALAEIERLPGRHIYFLDDHLLGHRRFAGELFAGMRGMGRVFQGASTVDAILRGDLIERAAEAGMRSVFVGFETLDETNLLQHGKSQNLARDYAAVVRRAHSLGVMVNGSFVFGLDEDTPDVFDRTVEWAAAQHIETATFHIMTPYPGTGLHRRLECEGRITSGDWNRYNTRHVVYRPARMTPAELEAGYARAYREFYRWPTIVRSALGQPTARQTLRHVAYAGGWKTRADVGRTHPPPARERHAADAGGDAGGVRWCAVAREAARAPGDRLARSPQPLERQGSSEHDARD
jgi:radical SAM superfamily enzyme YgiQ (UPF0313 family)